jgi:hypothetical protein
LRASAFVRGASDEAEAGGHSRLTDPLRCRASRAPCCGSGQSPAERLGVVLRRVWGRLGCVIPVLGARSCRTVNMVSEVVFLRKIAEDARRNDSGGMFGVECQWSCLLLGYEKGIRAAD